MSWGLLRCFAPRMENLKASVRWSPLQVRSTHARALPVYFEISRLEALCGHIIFHLIAAFAGFQVMIFLFLHLVGRNSCAVEFDAKFLLPECRCCVAEGDF